ncbi:fumarylacetoacetate hydrolase family protein [Lewinella sp. W8]|uniref:fumarylacetoacetate hydrolase family protein n=1 Tax=Lewinella sp. W8 TaxID=2528208 RepID=UPI00106862CF|nr:fumarylacetoacetate hydrolase family protein [Lewinella sp. W8]MTB52086.1 2-hydroxyhepta-2,4-diene-1,7-dioate isomerase [Lewinella sp. W8]
MYACDTKDWNALINDDALHATLREIVSTKAAESTDSAAFQLLKPIGDQEVWACGVTYLKSKVGRQEESQSSGGADFYERVYAAERPEVFFKALPHRVSGPGETVRIRKDSSWDVPEPELTLVVTSSGKIVGYTVGNDMSSRSIEGENPLYLPQAKTYDKCAAIGPGVLVTESPLPPESKISLKIDRAGEPVFADNIELRKMKRSLSELVSFVYRECSFPDGCYIMTGTGIVPGSDFTLRTGDRIEISIDGIGTLVNTVE